MAKVADSMFRSLKRCLVIKEVHIKFLYNYLRIKKVKNFAHVIDYR